MLVQFFGLVIFVLSCVSGGIGVLMMLGVGP